MKFFNTNAWIFISLFALFFQTSCKKETDNFDLFPISISVVDTLSTIKVKWTKVETSDFLEYVVVRSNKDSIPSFNELNTNSGAVIVNRVFNAKQTEFLDLNVGQLTSKLYYRIFVRLKNRTISSPNFIYNNNLSLLNIPQFNTIVQDKFKSNLLYFWSSNTSQIVLYDIDKDSILAKTQYGNSSYSSTIVSNNGANTEFVQVVGQKIVFRDATTFDVKSTIDFLFSVYTLSGSDDDFVCVSTEESNKQFKLIRASDRRVMGSVSNYIGNNYFSSSSTYIHKVPNERSFLLQYGSTIAKLSYDVQGNITQTAIVYQNINNFSISSLKTSPLGRYYFSNNQFYTLPFDPNQSLNIILPSSSYNDLIFASDDSKFYLSRSESFNSIALEEYSLPNGKLLRNFNSKITGRMIIHKGKIHVFSNNSNNSNQVIVQKIQL